MFPYTSSLEDACWAMVDETALNRGALENCSQSNSDAALCAHSTRDCFSQQLAIEEEYRMFLCAERELLKKELDVQMLELDKQMAQARANSEWYNLVDGCGSTGCQTNTSQTGLQSLSAAGPAGDSPEGVGASIDVHPSTCKQGVYEKSATTADAPYSVHSDIDEQLMVERESLLQEQGILMVSYSQEVSKLCQEMGKLGDPHPVELLEVLENHQQVLSDRKMLQELLAEQHLGLINDIKGMKVMPPERNEFCRSPHQQADEELGSLQPVGLADNKKWCPLQYLATKEQSPEDMQDATLTASTVLPELNCVD